MRAQRATRLAAASAVGILMAGGAAIGTAGPAAAAAPAEHTRVTTDWCGGWGDWHGRCFDRHGSRFDHHRFRFDHHGFVIHRGGVVVIIL